jgi:DNA-directed RNA polymerase specialized sigma24 family protein
MTGHFDPHGNASRGGQYTTTAAAVADYDSVLRALNLTTAQATFIRLRMAGYGSDAIATYMGVSSGRVYNIAKAIRAKCEKIGFTPAMWAEMTAEK